MVISGNEIHLPKYVPQNEYAYNSKRRSTIFSQELKIPVEFQSYSSWVEWNCQTTPHTKIEWYKPVIFFLQFSHSSFREGWIQLRFHHLCIIAIDTNPRLPHQELSPSTASHLPPRESRESYRFLLQPSPPLLHPGLVISSQYFDSSQSWLLCHSRGEKGVAGPSYQGCISKLKLALDDLLIIIKVWRHLIIINQRLC